MNFLLQNHSWILIIGLIITIYRPEIFPFSSIFISLGITTFYFIFFSNKKLFEKKPFIFNFFYITTIVISFGSQFFYSNDFDKVSNFLLQNVIIITLASSIYFMIDSITRNKIPNKNKLNYFEIFFAGNFIILLVTLFSGGFSFGANIRKLGTRLVVNKIFNLNLDFIDPNLLGAFASISILLLIVSWKEFKQPPFILKISTLPMFILVFLTQSKSSILSFLIGLISLYSYEIKSMILNFQIKKKIFYYIFSFILFISILLNTQILKENIDDFSRRISDISLLIEKLNDN